MNTINPLTNEQLRSISPAIFAEAPHQRASDQYSFIPTIKVIDALRDEQWFPVSAQSKKVRNQDRAETCRHIVKFQKEGAVLASGTRFELICVNSHDTGSSYQFLAGAFRMFCTNGLVVSEADVSRSRIHHIGHDIIDVVSDVVDAAAGNIHHIGHDIIDVVASARRVAQSTDKVAGVVDSWSRRLLNLPEVEALAGAAVRFRFGQDMSQAPIEPESLLRVRRGEDRGSDLWTQFNVVQENIVRGGVQTYGRRRENGRRFGRIRAVSGLDENIELNQKLWNAASVLNTHGAPAVELLN